jgi:hypothetical protein
MALCRHAMSSETRTEPNWVGLFVDEAGPGGHRSDQRGAACVGLCRDRSRRHGRRQTRGDLRRAGRRDPRREPRRGPAPRPGTRRDRRCPSPQRAPARRRGARPRAHLGPDHRRRLPDERPQRQRQADRRPSVVAPGLDPSRHHHDHRAARRAQVALARNEQRRRCESDLRRPKNLPVPHAMTVQAQGAPGGPARTVAPRAPTWSCLLDRWRSQQPILDAERAVNDE